VEVLKIVSFTFAISLGIAAVGTLVVSLGMDPLERLRPALGCARARSRQNRTRLRRSRFSIIPLRRSRAHNAEGYRCSATFCLCRNSLAVISADRSLSVSLQMSVSFV
jgi:hypothetical protein